jgi:kynureninase
VWPARDGRPSAHFAASAGYDLIEGIVRIRENSLRQTQLLLDLADAAGFEVTSVRDPARRGGAVIVNVPEAAAVYAELEAREILCEFRPGAGIGIGPHFFWTDDEVRLAIAQVEEILETGAYQRRPGAVATH